MIKIVVRLSLGAMLIALNAHAQRTTTHPLLKVIHKLGDTAQELEDKKNELKNDDDLASLIGDLRKQTSDLTVNTLMAPLRADLKKMSRKCCTYERIKNSDSLMIVFNDSGSQLQRDAEELDPRRWGEIADLTKKQQSDVASITSILSDPELSRGMLGGHSYHLKDVVSSYDGIIDDLSRRANMTIECIGSLNSIEKETGLRPVVFRDSYVFDSEYLMNVYGVDHILKVPKEQKGKLLKNLTKLNDGIEQNFHFAGYLCSHREAAAFVEAEIKRLSDKSSK